MKAFDQIDTTALKAFYFAAQTGNFTKAQESAGLTQSGISQHIKKLEDRLGTVLFDRSEKKLRLTESGLRLYEFSHKLFEEMNTLFDDLESKTKNPYGEVSYAMPASCMKTPHFPLLLKAHPTFPQVSLKVTLLSNKKIYELLLSDQIHFGFMTSEIEHKSLLYQTFAEESYLCVGRAQSVATVTEKNFAEQYFINYPGMDTLFEFWRKDQMPRRKGLHLNSLKIRGEINDLDGAITMCVHGLGFGIFPKHCVENELKHKSLTEIKWRDGVSKEKIYIVRKRERIQPERVKRVLAEFMKMKSH